MATRTDVLGLRRLVLRQLRPLLLTGFGLGAFLDGIVLHQVLQ